VWLVGAVKVRVKPGALEKLLITKGTRSIALERAKPIHSFFDEVNFSTGSSEPKNPLSEEIGWGVRKVGAEEVWKSGVQGDGVVVAVLDSGVNVNHPDLEGNIWKNPGEQGLDADGNEKASNGLDDDNNGYVDDVYGWNFEENSSDISDYMGHGTQAAGIIAGQGKKGVQTGMAPKAKIMSLRTCCMLGGEVAESAIWESIQYAMKNGARVLSMSVSMKHWGKPNYPQWRRASEVLNVAGIVHVNSAGNRGKGNEPYNIGAPGSNPPAWLHPNQADNPSGVSSMITVGAVDFEDHLRQYSSIGPVTWEEVSGYKDFPFEKGQKKGLLKPEICAPSETPSLSFDGENYTLSFGGTSSATPHVAGAAALLISANPNLTVAQITESLLMSAEQIGGEFTNECGAGRLDIQKAVEYARERFGR
jgi:subtilisin family serine protease